MAYYLRDERITNTTIDLESIEKLCLLFTERLNTLNSGLAENDISDAKGLLTYIIRFDNKGYRVFSISELKNFYEQAKEVERIIITIESIASLKSNRSIGTYMELRLDKNDQNNCTLTVTSDDKDWVEASFSAAQEAISKFKNRNGYVRTSWTPFMVQIFGVFVGFTLCLWAAFKMSPLIKIENPFVIVFLFVLLIFSNIWTYLNAQLLRMLGNLFPNVRFVNEGHERIHWLFRTLVGSSIFAIILYLLNLAQKFLIDFFRRLLGFGA